MSELKPLLDERKWGKAVEFCENSNDVMSQVALQGIYTAKEGKNLGLALEAAAMLSEIQIKNGLRYLNAVVTVAPLLGLLGTVMGMIQSFSIFSIESGQPMVITRVVGEALIATATGLIVAVISFVMYLIFSRWSEKLLVQLDQVYIWMMIQFSDASSLKSKESAGSSL